MSTPSQRIRVRTFYPPKLGEAPLDELQRRAARLRDAIGRERELKAIVDAFTEDFVNEALFHELSRPSEDPAFATLISEAGLLGLRYRGEVFEKKLFFCAELGLFHGSVISPYHIGCAFQFAGDAKGVIAVSTFDDAKPVDFFRFSLVRGKSITSPGGEA